MILAFLLSLPAAQDGSLPTQQQEEVRWTLLESELSGAEVIYRVEGLRLEAEDVQFQADFAEIRLDRRRYLELTGAEPGVALPRPPPQKLPESRFTSVWTRHVLGALGLPDDDGLLLTVLLKDNVVVENEQLRLRCRHLYQDRRRGTTVVGAADLLLREGQGPGGWPFRILADKLLEAPDGSLRAERASITTCELPIAHYALKLDELTGRPLEEGRWRWSSAGAWLEIAGGRILPLPAPSFQTGESFLSLEGVQVHSNSRLGQALELQLGGGITLEEEEVELRWRLRPIFSSSRGLPLSLGFDIRTEDLETEWDFFYLRDQGEDAHPFHRLVDPGTTDRWQIALNNRYELSDAWRIEADLAFASDVLVAPEFFERSWRENDDAVSEIYLRNADDGHFFDVSLSARTDGSGVSPLEGFGAEGGPPPVILENLPLARYQSYATALFQVPVGFLGGADGEAPLNVRWGAEAGRLRLRDIDLDAPSGNVPFTPVPSLTRDRAWLWAEASLPLDVGGLFLRPGVRAQAVAYDENLDETGSADRQIVEGFAELGALVVKTWDHGWSHRVLPQIRFRDRNVRGERPDQLVTFDQVDAQSTGQVVEFSLRQFFMAPDSPQPWMDLDVMLPYYPDPKQPLEDRIAPTLFPAVARSSNGERWGPAEVRLEWNPGVYGETLEGIRLETRWRQDLSRGQLDEIFSRLTISPSDRLSYGASLRKVDGLFSIGEAFADWRFSEDWGLYVAQPYNFTGDAGKRSRASLQRYFHDFVVEAGLARNQATGETGVFFNFTPRFLVDRPGSPQRSRMSL